mmetsp:Transcript_10335/g.19604  ORF Transcript_10335/g.19604 Transcript_10335/m.19604 type:complete len:320 (-) Transcript_10335:443-1402(-)
MFHEKHKDVAVAVNVTRHPYSFAGSDKARQQDGVWKWKDGLAVYAGDQLQRQMIASGVSHAAVAALRSPDPWTACQPHMTELTHALQTAKAMGLPGCEELLHLLNNPPANSGGVSATSYAKGQQIHPADQVAGAQACKMLGQLGHSVDISFNFDVDFSWHPVDSQRLLLWAARQGKAEELMSVFSMHQFEHQKSVNSRAVLLDAVNRTEGLDMASAELFLMSAELEDEVWTSYHNTIHRKNIHSIPYFVFTLNVQGGGPFRQGSGREFKVHGSANAQTFNDVFESLWQEQQKAAKVTNNQGSEKKTGSGEKGIRRGFLG